MPTFEERMTAALKEKLESEETTKLIQQQAESAIKEAIKDAFKSYSNGIGKVIEEQIKSTLTPMVEKYNFSEHAIKLEALLDDVIQSMTRPNNQVLEGFKKIVTAPEEINLSELFKHYCKFISKEVETYGRKIDYENGSPSYEPVTADMSFSESENTYSWSDTKYADVVFQVSDGVENEDELKKLNFVIPLIKFRHNDYWTIRSMGPVEIKDLRYMNEFEVLLRTLNQMFSKIIDDKDYLSEEVGLDAEPEWHCE